MKNNTENTGETFKSETALREEAILSFWEKENIFNKSVEKDAPNGDFVFYDGPPFATGLPHYGHILASTIKDSIPRFWTMNGFRVRRKWGWDCHGLPLENLIEKKLGLATKRDIEAFGVKNFNEAARDAVMEYADDWKQIIPRMGRWADMENDYKTMDAPYTESVWWVFHRLHEKGLVFEGFKSMHLCPRCGTTLSNFEVNQGYKDIKDIAVTVKLPLVGEPETSLLVWTTTPWTLPGNMAAAVHNDIDYVKVKVTTPEGGDTVILAKARLAQLGQDNYETLQEMKGSDLVGRLYVPPFDYFKGQVLEGVENAWKIYHADYVELGEEGTGAVHLAPAYGEDDMNVAKAAGIPLVHHVDHDGHFMDFVTDFAGQLVKPKDDEASEVSHLDADIEILRALKEKGLLFKKENITHSYPHCWRCDTPLLNYATTSWFIRVPEIKDELVAENNKVHWVPPHVGTSRFGKWLEGARDWAVSRQRYWGAPLPIWRNEITKEYKVFKSLADLQEYIPKSGNTYFVMRHAEAESNLSDTVDAIPDENNPLTPKGKEQCVHAAAILKDKKIDLIIHSGMQRTRETAELIAEALGLPKSAVESDERITEIQTGVDLEGKTWEDYNALYANEREKFTKVIPGVENRIDIQKRAGAFLYDINTRYTDKHILIVGHASSTFALRSAAIGADIEKATAIRSEGYLDNAEIREISFTPFPHNDNYELDYHRPYIDDIELVDTDGVRLVRVPDVFDCWFESGAMPYGEQHYPFENTDSFEPEKNIGYPAQFVAEGIDQTRGWFYSLIVLGTALFGKAPFQNVIVNGLVLAEDGKKMSKSLKNYPDPMDVANRTGVDAMRFYLLSSSIIKAEDLNFSEKGVEELQRKNIGRLHNVLAMYEMFANGTSATDSSKNVLDMWILSKLHQTMAEVTEGYKNYELDRATRPITDIIDDVSVWYLRRSRDRFKGEDEADKNAALGTLRYVLQKLALIMAPSMPFYAEYLWGKVKEESDVLSVHLASWPSTGRVDEALVSTMSFVRSFATMGLMMRSEKNIKVRQPLQTFIIKHDAEIPAYWDECKNILEDELNVKEVLLQKNLPENHSPVDFDFKITPELKAEGDVREFIRAVQDMRKKASLSPQDRVALVVQTSDGGEALLTHFELHIKTTVGAESIVFGNAEGDEVVAGEHSFTVQISKS